MSKIMKVINENLSNPDLNVEKLAPNVGLSRVQDHQKLKELTENIAKLALPDSARIIAQEVIKLAEAKS